ncbi:CS1 type fimbrial major subunit [Pseudomonas sp. ANT_H12B]|uniref:CS1 type fimbrial major subunit n=1 Tax=Pseudomonas sp. ANT_H12B TaxID=2597348 RepID=UPI0011EC6589|nr:CS1 type fimbrial major subunit [Pseudomonas sp. ANT_H12B]KAA0960446.1 hypothetical protein FQ185_25500 [Pseudomonas sp. ANT_H12B]
MIKQLITLTSMVLATLTSVGAPAIVERQTFAVSVTVPNAEFYVIPVNPGWIGREQKLNWNLTTEELSPLRKYFDVRNSNGAIAVRLSMEPYLSNGRDSDNIALAVRFNHTRLTVDNTQVISQLDGKTGKRVELEIAAIKPVSGYKPGDYHGSVHMIFEAISP